jgi:uncharacterized protein with HEPN domain
MSFKSNRQWDFRVQDILSHAREAQQLVAHDYHTISYALVFTTIQDYIPELIRAIEAALPTLRAQPSSL